MKINAIYKGKIEEAFFKDRLDAYKASRQTDILGKVLEKIKSTPFTIPKELLASIYFRSGDEQHYEPESQINAELMYALNRNINAQNKDRIINYIARSVFDRYSSSYDYEKFIKNATSAVSFAPKTEPAAVDPVAQAAVDPAAQAQAQATSAEPPQTPQAQTPQAQTPQASGLRRLDVLTALNNSKIDSGNEQIKDKDGNLIFTKDGKPSTRKASELKLRQKLTDISGDKRFNTREYTPDVMYNFLNSILDKIPIKDSKEYNEISLLREGLKELYHSATDPEYQQYITGEQTNEKKEQIGVVHTIRKTVEKMIEMYIQETDKLLRNRGSNIQDYTRQLEQHMKSQKYAHKSNKAAELAQKYADPGSIKNYQRNDTAAPTTPDTPSQTPSPQDIKALRMEKWNQQQQAKVNAYDTLEVGGRGVNSFDESANFYSGQQFVFEADWYEA